MGYTISHGKGGKVRVHIEPFIPRTKDNNLVPDPKGNRAQRRLATKKKMIVPTKRESS